MVASSDLDVAMVIASGDEGFRRDYSRSAQVLIAIGLRLLVSDQGEENDDEPNGGLRQGVD
jgi:hypothetical protein